jgi:hypothetical protein
MENKELCYLVSTSTLKAILSPLATAEARYQVVRGQDAVTVVLYGPLGLIHQVAFPVVYSIPEVPEEEGTLILMVATERSREWESFWLPVQEKLVEASEGLPA